MCPVQTVTHVSGRSLMAARPPEIFYRTFDRSWYRPAGCAARSLTKRNTRRYMVYNNTQYPELVTAVRDGDAVLMPSGYHPNVSVPGHRIAFLWAMAAHREVEDRKFGVVNVQPGFQQSSSGLEAARK